MKTLFSILTLLLGVYLAAQEKWQNPNYREKLLMVKDSVVLDSMYILPDKFVVKNLDGTKISSDQYQLKGNVLWFKQVAIDSIQVSYYVHPNYNSIVTYPKDPSLIVPSASETSAIVLHNIEKEEIEIFDGLNSKGTLVRGVMFGNKQGSSVQSSLNLQLDGKLSEKVGVTAFISDTNAPLEVEGYTQSLDQFERIYLELFTDNSKIRAGHIDLEQNQNYFGQYHRKVTGLQLSHTLDNEQSKNKIEAAVSLSRGQYTRFEFIGNEGNQGPYRLEGNNQDAYVLIIAGSERVYRNGQLLELGEDKDYILNYATGEITFTSNFMVTASDRFIVEYQYTNRNYNRFSWMASAEHQSKRFKISGHVYTESDNKNNPINQNLSQEDKMILAHAGSDSNPLYTDSGIATDFQEDRVLYQKIIQKGIEVYQYSTDPSKVLYHVNFTYVGENNGDYILSDNSINGRVFLYVSPIQGEAQGDYAAVRQLTAPERKQLFGLSSSYKLKNEGEIKIDVGLSNHDNNLYSSMDDKDNIGLGIKVTAGENFEHPAWKIKPMLSYEFIQKNFQPIERLRKPEFARDFNLNQEVGASDQHFLQSNIRVQYQDSLMLHYGFDFLNQLNNYKGFRHRINGTFRARKLVFLTDASYLNTQSNSMETQFLRYNVLGSKKVKNLILTTGIHGESNKNHYAAQDSLSVQWSEFYTAASIGDSLQKYLQLRSYRRIDDSTRYHKLMPYSKSWGVQLKSRLIHAQNQSLEILTDYRNVNYAIELPESSFLNAYLNYRKTLFNQGILFNLNYGISGNTEQQRAFVYTKVTDGMGLYQWIDLNKDGIQQIDEFELAQFTDQANYIRVFTNVYQSIRTNQNQMTINFGFYPSKIFKGDLFKRFQSKLAYSQKRNYLKNNAVAAFNPFQQKDDQRGGDSSLFIQNDWNNGKNYMWHLRHQYKQNKTIHLIYTGLESVQNSVNELQLKYDFQALLTAEISHKLESTQRDSETFASRRYHVKGQKWSPQIHLGQELGLQSYLAYEYGDFKNTMGVEKLTSHTINFGMQWNKLGKIQILTNASWVRHNFIGEQNGLVANHMMQGLKNGKNWVWDISLSHSINNFMTLELQYNGRKNEDLNAIHTGNMMIRINF